jgi:hypothetical protein
VLWAGDVRKKLLVNVQAFGGDVALVTITAPGAEVLPWEKSGERLVQRDAARHWNRTARTEWTRLHRKAAQRAGRHAKRGGGRWAIVAQSWEFQKRGVLHKHVIVPMATAADIAASHEYVRALDDMRHRHGFGFVDRGRRSGRGPWGRRLGVVPQQRAARYLAKYIAAVEQDGKLALSETVTHPEVPGHVVYVSRRLSARTGCTMRSLRLARLIHVVAARLDLPEPEIWEMHDSGVRVAGLRPASELGP